MKTKQHTTILVLVILISIFGGCATQTDTPPASLPAAESTPPVSAPQSAEPETPSGASAEERVVTDMAGRKVTLPSEVKTVATFGSVGVLNAFVELMGAGGRICHDMSPSFTRNDNWAMQYEFAPQIKGAPVLENADREVLIEEVLALNPDLCLTMTLPTAELLAENGLSAVYLSWAEVDDVKTAVNLMGEILGTQDIAADYIKYFDETVARASEITAQISERKTAVYGNVVNLTQPHVIAEWWISAAGGESVTSDANTGESLTYTTEDLLLWNPDVIFINANQADELKADAQLSGITAIKNDAIYFVPTVAHTWGNRTVEQPLTILWALNKMYPELYGNDELTEDIRYFYTHFFNYEMSDEQIIKIIG